MMLEHFTPTQNSDNRHRFLQEDKKDEIIIGATITHVFKLPFKYSTYTGQNADKLEICYKQGLTVILEKDYYDVEITEFNNSSIIKVVLSPLDTEKFSKNSLDTFVQIKLVNSSGDVLYNDPGQLIISKPLDQ